MNFELPEPLASLRQKVRAFVDERVIPSERRIVDEDRDGTWDTLRPSRLADTARCGGASISRQ